MSSLNYIIQQSEVIRSLVEDQKQEVVEIKIKPKPKPKENLNEG